MQLNWIEVDDVPNALKELAEVGLHGIQSSGFLRNITCDDWQEFRPMKLLIQDHMRRY